MDVETSVVDYMELVGGRWRGLLFGLGILGNQVYLAQMKVEDTPGLSIMDPERVWDKGGWVSMFDKKFVKELERMYDHSMVRDSMAPNV